MSNPSKVKTNRDLLLALAKNVMDQKDDIFVYVESLDKYFPVTAIKFAKKDDVLDKGHMFLVIR